MQNAQTYHQASRILIAELRAKDSRTKEALRAYLLEQCPGVNQNNVDAVLGRVLDAFQVLGIVDRHVEDGYPWYELNYPRCGAIQLPC